MDPKLFFWTLALADLGVVCAVALFGIRYARSGEIARHKRAMKIASLLVLAFLGAYVLKLQFLGREDMSLWSTFDVWVLRIHELCVFAMLVGGVIALILSRKMHRSRSELTRLPDTPLASSRTLRNHRRAGWSAAIAAGFAFLTAAIVLVGMYERAGNH